jgi:hypothetical protein
VRLHLAAISPAPLLRHWLVSLQLGVVADKVGSEAQVVLVIYSCETLSQNVTASEM